MAALWAGLFCPLPAAADANGNASGGRSNPEGGAAVTRVEARSTDLLAVGLVHGDRLSIHLSQLLDNAPVRDAAVTVVMRGASHPATAETDGSFTLQSKELNTPGAVAVEFQVTRAGVAQSLKGTLQISAAGRVDEKNTARQLWWWVLNFAVCIGFLLLISRRRKAAQT
jgi:hypothetical protein